MKKTQAIINVESAVVEVHSKTLFERVSDYLTEKDWGFNSYEEKTYFTLNLRLTSGTVRVVIDIAESSPWARILVYATYPTFVPPHRRVEVIDAINRINYSLLAGCLEMDAKDGEVRARMMLESDTFVSEQMIDRAMRRCLDLAEQYQAPLLAIAFGNAAAHDVLELGERAEDVTLQ
ncbi:MAG: hypothetical protein BWK72_19160 [Rhodoferax ferrireducens]|uniref:YbjN domain-containing protein n=1 Tax=Rhodoferax ferrireducens TaxID=192843 RepID=A0A1W9KPF5_9BURK|nr:MAG: hypothetical protein BWK72_19160 [Rhodoferax ferrireducens]